MTGPWTSISQGVRRVAPLRVIQSAGVLALSVLLFRAFMQVVRTTTPSRLRWDLPLPGEASIEIWPLLWVACSFAAGLGWVELVLEIGTRLRAPR